MRVVVIAVLREIDGHDCGGVGSCCFVCVFFSFFGYVVEAVLLGGGGGGGGIFHDWYTLRILHYLFSEGGDWASGRG